ncbi:mCpol domain-containing protein [Marinobacter nauticus]|uniref:mCpol domain-containing protein n=1 Tax=Marinobacter nauticus TaxID=2743 RepID=UPI0032B2BFAE|tara:strand:+ start:2137 stop:2532 length:396 start_codon:yes stop_codon:yes gene_type:complete
MPFRFVEVNLNYISIDGDDVGRKITSLYLENATAKLSQFCDEMKGATEKISNFLKGQGFEVIFCAADGVAASIESDIDFERAFTELCKFAPEGITLSAGVGQSLSQSYIALLSAKSNGKNCIHRYSRIGEI